MAIKGKTTKLRFNGVTYDIGESVFGVPFEEEEQLVSDGIAEFVDETVDEKVDADTEEGPDEAYKRYQVIGYEDDPEGNPPSDPDKDTETGAENDSVEEKDHEDDQDTLKASLALNEEEYVSSGNVAPVEESKPEPVQKVKSGRKQG